MIDLFRPYIDTPAALANLAQVLTPDADGRVFIGEGPWVKRLEQEFGELVGTPEPPLAVDSCTSALTLALYLAGVGPGDEVISTPMTCTATNGAIVSRGARIVWADIDPLTGLLRPDSVRDCQGDRVKAVVAVDWAGRLCDYPALKAGLFHVPVIQDAAHSLLAGGRGFVMGDYVCWSLGPIKHLTSGGHGGMLLTPPEQARRGRLLRWHGLDRETAADFRCAQSIVEAGWKMHLTDVDAAIGLANLPHAESIVERQRANARWYHQALRGLPGAILPLPDDGCSWWLYGLLIDDRNGFIDRLAARGIAASPVHARNDTHPAYAGPSGPLPGVRFFASRFVAIPVGWWLSEDDRERVAEACWSAVKAMI